MIKVKSRLAQLGAGVAMVALITSALALGASGEAQAQAKTDAAAVSADAGSIVCSGDLCIQTISVNTTYCLAVVAAWADTSNFKGHFEMAVPSEDYVQNSTGGNKEWYAGGANYKFTVPFYGEGAGYQATAWRYNGSSYTDIGRVNFTINVPSFC